MVHDNPRQPIHIPPERIALLQKNLLRWFHCRARDLPWRRTRDPYAIWVSEIMLQQTQVDTVIDYYRRFLARFPDVEHLARARLDTVLKLWEGLGYYGRARNLHKAARQIVGLSGQLPRDASQWRQLPGIGEYTANAIASIAWDQSVPVVDGNVIRVMSRLFCIAGDPKTPQTYRTVRTYAQMLVPEKGCGDYNQALMELGALVCRPKGPDCRHCPVKALCEAFDTDRTDVFPETVKRTPIPLQEIAVGIVFKSGRILIDRRPPKGLLGGLWEFPGGKINHGESPEQAAIREVWEELRIRITVQEPLVTVHHAYTHFKVRIHAFLCRHLEGRPLCRSSTAVRWIWPSQLDRYAFPAANKRIIQTLRHR